MHPNETITLLFAEQGDSLQEKLVQILENLMQGDMPQWNRTE